jgi:hypothetical protein
VTNVAYAEPFRTGLPVADDEREPAGRVPATRPAHLPARRPSVTTQSMIGEKLSDDGSINDKDNVYSWQSATSERVALLNITTFAGYSDWRLPARL